MSVHEFPGKGEQPNLAGVPKKPKAGDGMTMDQLQEELAYYQQMAKDQGTTSAFYMEEFTRLNGQINRLGEYLRSNYALEIERKQYPHQGELTAVDAALYYMEIERRRFGVRFRKLMSRFI